MAEFTVEQEFYLELRRKGYGPIVSARTIGSTAREVDEYLRLDRRFADAVDEAIAESMEKVEHAVIESAQDGDLVAARLVLESHKPAEWTKPERDINFNVLPQGFDVDDLHRRLGEAARKKAIEVTSREAKPDDSDDVGQTEREAPERAEDHEGAAVSDP